MSEESEKLSQREIDALLSVTRNSASPASSTQTGKKVRPYDFRSPVKFSKEQLWTLQMMHEMLAKRMMATFSVYLRSKTHVTIAYLEQGTYASFIADMPKPTVAFIISMKPLAGRIMLEIRPELATILIDRMLGGGGVVQMETRQVTDLELILVRKAVDKILVDLKGVWESVVELQPEVEDVVLNPHLAGLAIPTDAAVLVIAEIRFEENSGALSITIPHAVLEPVLQRLSSTRWTARLAQPDRRASDESLQRVSRHMVNLRVPVSVQLGKVSLALDELVNLRVGDFLALDTRRDELLKVFVSDCHKYYGRPGLVGNRVAVTVVSPTRNENAEELFV